MKRLFFCLCFAMIFSLILGCSTTVPMSVTRPANLEVPEASSIAILPFQTGITDSHAGSGNVNIIIDVLNNSSKPTSSVTGESSIANYVTTGLTSKFATSPYFKLVDASVVTAAINNGREIPVDLYITGVISGYQERIETYEVAENDIQYYLTVEFSIVYQIVDSHTYQVLAYRTVDVDEVSTNEYSKSDLPSPLSLVKSRLDSFISQVDKEFHPYTVTRSLTLLKDKEKHPDFKMANEYAKKGNLLQSEELFYSIYKSTGNFAAGYNAALLMQANGRLEDGRDLLEELQEKTGREEALQALSEVNYELRQAELVREQRERKAQGVN